MKLLILGGTRFLGHHLVTIALAHKHEVTLFNRGQHSSTAFSGVETIYGDRHHDLALLQGHQWDAVIDTCGYLPRSVRASAEILANLVDRYVFISSLSVYADVTVPGVDEASSLVTLTDEQLQRANAIDTSGQVSAMTYGDLYGGLKVLCEQAIEEIMPNRSLILRPGLIVGVGDYTDRFTYWVVRVACGGEVLAPGNPNRYLQLIDVRDLAEWVLNQIEAKATGIYNNVNGMPSQLTMKTFLEQCKAVSNSDALFTWVSDEFLVQKQVAPWSEVPLWIPDEMSELKGFMFIDCSQAFTAGLKLRPVSQTIQDVLSWRKTHHSQEKLKAGLDSDKEQDLLSQWHEMQQYEHAQT
ncbi:NAD-dependent epimerase/dehydratase family protein [Nodosilinea sp. LEGE 07088]|uniref:NAD-dependent epimerase/dehydratase family protein n=1 Tax=Nodosilinea sp. LEGE 07088 TaxID=2777968 RepID=UPI00187FB6BE|nr:NAD-dependent epimerase/dehydratase family protein [Nodosilinea sp. LEGE 07088]MBE9141421.1 NAD-dependent epimerase/dehydratase family protein [Nodosilinea sp. LEGE 07088]